MDRDQSVTISHVVALIQSVASDHDVGLRGSSRWEWAVPKGRVLRQRLDQVSRVPSRPHSQSHVRRRVALVDVVDTESLGPNVGIGRIRERFGTVQATQLTDGAPWGAVGEFEGDVGVREESQSRRKRRRQPFAAEHNPSQDSVIATAQ